MKLRPKRHKPTNADVEAMVRENFPRMLAAGLFIECAPAPGTTEPRYKLRKDCTAEEIDVSEAKHGKHRA